MRQIALAALTASVMFAGSAFAADIAVKTPVPASLAVLDWSGIYAGVQGGYGLQ